MILNIRIDRLSDRWRLSFVRRGVTGDTTESQVYLFSQTQELADFVRELLVSTIVLGPQPREQTPPDPAS